VDRERLGKNGGGGGMGGGRGGGVGGSGRELQQVGRELDLGEEDGERRGGGGGGKDPRTVSPPMRYAPEEPNRPEQEMPAYLQL